jgi:hypothetical protein
LNREQPETSVVSLVKIGSEIRIGVPAHVTKLAGIDKAVNVALASAASPLPTCSRTVRRSKQVRNVFSYKEIENNKVVGDSSKDERQEKRRDSGWFTCKILPSEVIGRKATVDPACESKLGHHSRSHHYQSY